MRSKNSMYNLVAAIMLQVTTLIVGLILPRVMLSTFGSEINGLTSSIKQFIAYLSLVEAGLAGACIYSLYKPLADKEYDKINSILSGAKKFYNKSGILFSILAFVLAVIFPHIIQSNDISRNTIILLVLILGINGALEFFSMGKYRVLLTADQKSYIISIIQTIAQILNCIIIVILALCKCDIVTVQLFGTISYIIRSCLFNVYVKRNYKFIDFNVEPSKEALNQRWDVLIHQIGSMVIFNSPIAFITFFCSLIEVSIYSIYNMVFAGVYGIVSIFNNGLMAGIGDIISRKDYRSLQRVYREYECGYYMIVTWIYSCTYVLVLPFIKLYTNGIKDAQYSRLDMAILFSVIGLLNTLRIPQLTVVGAAGHYKQTKYRSVMEVIINLLASFVFVKRVGMIGVLLGAICSYTYRTVDLILYAPKKITYLPVKETAIRIIRMIALIGIIVMPFEMYIDIQVVNFIQWIIWACIISIWSLLVVGIGNYIFERDIMVSLIKRIIVVTKSIRG